MKIWWEVDCDLGHHWTIVLPEGVAPPDDETRCPVDGSPAVTAARQPPADRVVVTIRPAARVVDAATGQIGRDSEYFLEISSHDARESRQSARVFSWDEAVQKATMFQKATWELAVRRWARMGMDNA